MQELPLTHPQAVCQSPSGSGGQNKACREARRCKGPIPLELCLLWALRMELCAVARSPWGVRGRAAEARREDEGKAEVILQVQCSGVWAITAGVHSHLQDLHRGAPVPRNPLASRCLRMGWRGWWRAGTGKRPWQEGSGPDWRVSDQHQPDPSLGILSGIVPQKGFGPYFVNNHQACAMWTVGSECGRMRTCQCNSCFQQHFSLETFISFYLELSLRMDGIEIQLCGREQLCLRGVSVLSDKIEKTGCEQTVSKCVFDLFDFLRGV